MTNYTNKQFYLSTNVLKYSYAIAWKQICKCCRTHVSIHFFTFTFIFWWILLPVRFMLL